MPYIKQEDRPKFEEALKELVKNITNEGELNYCLTRIMIDCIFVEGAPQPAYADYNKVIGAVECAKLEMYRRYLAFYENHKIDENGDV